MSKQTACEWCHANGPGVDLTLITLPQERGEATLCQACLVRYVKKKRRGRCSSEPPAGSYVQTPMFPEGSCGERRR
jgi:hypothetical protein